MRTILLIAFAAAVATLANAQDARLRPAYMLDLTCSSATPTAIPRLAKGTTPRAGGGFQALPLVMLLDDLETNSTATEVTYRVTLRHVGHAPLALPWSTDFLAIESFGEPPSLAVLGLRIVDSAGRPHRIGTILLGGTSRLPASMITLQPGETAVIKAKGLITLTPEKRRALASDSPRTVRAELSLQPRPPTAYSILESANAVARTLTRPRTAAPPRE